VAHAVREDTGDPFGIECAGDTAHDAIERLTRWLDWQGDHAAALDALQQAERAYHRTVSGSAFTSPTEGPTAVEIQRDALAAVERARMKLDSVRALKPEA
jgi:hypothetical protein